MKDPFEKNRQKALSRRDFIQRITLATVGFALSSACSHAQSSAKIIVVGGGVGGISFIRTLTALNPEIDITLIEPTAHYHTCPLSSHVLADLLPDSKVMQTYINIASLPNVTWIREMAQNIDANKKQVITSSGTILSYDKLLISPGIGLKTQSIENYDAVKTPHGWKNDSSLFALKSQLHAMEDGGTFILTAPHKPYRCTPAPYERASLVAAYLNKHKPRSKVLILDQKPSFPQQGLFFDAWQQYYGDMIEWVTGDFVGEITAYNANESMLETEFDSFKGDVINLIPNQNAGDFARRNGLVNDTGWCPVDLRTMESALVENIYIIGDAIDDNELPKAASITETQGHVAAMSVNAALREQTPPTAIFNSLCWSATDEAHAVKVMGAYHVENNGSLIRDSLAISSAQDSEEERLDNYAQAKTWNSDLITRLYGAQ